MDFVPHTDDGCWYVLHHYPDPRPDEPTVAVYVTSPDATVPHCSCPDFDYRHAQTAEFCKHIGALRLHLGLPVVTPRPSLFADTEEGRAERREWALQNRNLDF